MTHSSRSANQSKTEPVPASATESESETPGQGAPQQPGRLRPERTGAGDAAGVPTSASQAAPGSSEELPVAQGIHEPEVDEPDPRT
jgi:hypothetical protein